MTVISPGDRVCLILDSGVDPTLHYTPKHGSWLNIAEIELSALVRQCLDRRIPDKDTLNLEVHAWEDQRNSEDIKIHWPFTTADARVKLKSLYPKFEL